MNEQVGGIFIDPPRRGEVVMTTYSHTSLHEVEAVLPEVDWLARGTEATVRPIETTIVTYHLLEYEIGGRIFRIWSKASIPDLVDEISIIMTLIDMAPEDIRRCEVAGLTIPVNPM